MDVGIDVGIVSNRDVGIVSNRDGNWDGPLLQKQKCGQMR